MESQSKQPGKWPLRSALVQKRTAKTIAPSPEDRLLLPKLSFGPGRRLDNPISILRLSKRSTSFAQKNFLFIGQVESFDMWQARCESARAASGKCKNSDIFLFVLITQTG